MADCNSCDGKGYHSKIHEGYPVGCEHRIPCSRCGGSGNAEDYHYCCYCNARKEHTPGDNWKCSNCGSYD